MTLAAKLQWLQTRDMRPIWIQKEAINKGSKMQKRQYLSKEGKHYHFAIPFGPFFSSIQFTHSPDSISALTFKKMYKYAKQKRGRCFFSKSWIRESEWTFVFHLIQWKCHTHFTRVAGNENRKCLSLSFYLVLCNISSPHYYLPFFILCQQGTSQKSF